MKRALLLLISVFSMACNQTLKDFVKSPSRGRGESNNPSVSTPTVGGVKVSPGANIAEGSAVKAKYSITATSRTVEGTQVKSTFSLHSNRFN